MSIIGHLAELRNRLVWVFSSVALASIAGWVTFDRVVDLLLAPACPWLDPCRLIVQSPVEAFTIRIRVAVTIGFVIAFPIVLFHVWRFVAPGLHKHERKWSIPFIGAGMLLFCGGITFAYVTLPQALEFLIGPAITGSSVDVLLRVKEYVSFILLYLLAFGLTFQFPILLLFATLARIVTSKQLAKARRWVFMGIAVVVAFATPSVDFVTMGALTFALYVLYEASIGISRLLKR